MIAVVNGALFFGFGIAHVLASFVYKEILPENYFISSLAMSGCLVYIGIEKFIKGDSNE